MKGANRCGVPGLRVERLSIWRVIELEHFVAAHFHRGRDFAIIVIELFGEQMHLLDLLNPREVGVLPWRLLCQ